MISFIIELIALVFLLSVYFHAGVKKLFRITPTTDSISNLPLFNMLPRVVSLAATLGTIAIEIVAPVLIIAALFVPALKGYYKSSVYGLIIFTVLASLFYHPPTDPSQRTSFFKNLGLIGGFILTLDLID